MRADDVRSCSGRLVENEAAIEADVDVETVVETDAEAEAEADGVDVVAEPALVRWSRMSVTGAAGLLEGNSVLARALRPGGSLALYALLALTNIWAAAARGAGAWASCWAALWRLRGRTATAGFIYSYGDGDGLER
jgi:hypothetical protein